MSCDPTEANRTWPNSSLYGAHLHHCLHHPRPSVEGWPLVLKGITLPQTSVYLNDYCHIALSFFSLFLSLYFFSVIILSTTYNLCVYSVSLSATLIHIFLLFIFSLIAIPYCFSHPPWLWAELSTHPFLFWPYRDALRPPPLRIQGEKPPEITW